MSTAGIVHNGALRLRYVAWGSADAPAIVLLHGLRAYAHWFDDFAATAKERFRLIALDQRGRGGSDWAADKRYDTDSYVGDVASLANGLNLDRFALLGHSMGGTNAVAYAAANADRVSALVIVDSAPELDSRGLTRIGQELAITPARFESRDHARIFLCGLHARASDQSLETRLDWMLITRSDGTLDWRIDPAIFPLKPDSPERSWTALRQVACPTLVVRGALSDLVTADCADRMAAALAKGFRAEVPEAAHMVLEDNPIGFEAAALPFLERALPMS
ncbi:alpha/beta fold hydrolase [Beijerinckia sp. L45]|uniref:alpha/beta fold hydrolase n=1 Tax=Beijerinckia sp. L45 TaxID=1641855 RepID=UPI00131C6961|nr:alpha/beta hydrolase [Beijerinckia sp. L45]